MTEEGQLGPVARRLAATQRVVCIEDEGDIAAFLRAYFRAAGYDLVHLDPDSAESATDEIASLEPDLILLDLRLRGFSGTEIYRRLRSDDRYAFVPIVIISAHAATDPNFEHPTGIDAFVPKPFNTNTLAETVRERIEAAKELEEHGRDTTYDLLSQDYLTVRLADEITHGGPLSFALIQLTSTATITADVGDDGRRHVIGTLLKHVRTHLPPETVLGATSTSELAVIFPNTDTATAAAHLAATMDSIDSTFGFAGGAQVPIDVAAGVATFPDHGSDVDRLYMAADLALADAIDGGVRIQTAI